MTAGERVVAILFRVMGLTALLALIAVFIPLSWMTAAHRWLGLGEMPEEPVVEYLARSVSAFYALFGALLLLVASDVQRYRPLVQFLGAAFLLLGAVFLGVDYAAGMPWWWTAAEGPPGIAVGALVLLLVWADRRAGKEPAARHP